MVKAPVKLNGYPVIQSAIHSNGYVSVMVKREDEFMPYVVATWWPELKKSWSWGHYHYDHAEALESFNEVQERNAKRGGM
jgi:hypothetical protein